MPRFFFHLDDGTRLDQDGEGEEFSDLEAARIAAMRFAREVVAERLVTEENLQKLRVLVTDAGGRELATIRWLDLN